VAHLNVAWVLASPVVARLVAVLAIGIGAVVVMRLVAHGVDRLEAADARRPLAARARRTTFYRHIVSFARYFFGFIALTMILGEFNVHTSSLLAGAGIVGLALSFGAQRLVQDVMTGLFLLYEDQFQVGDQIAIPSLNVTGTVVEIGLRITRLLGGNGELLIVPNGLITQVTNFSRAAFSATVALPLDPANDPEHIRSVLEDVVAALAPDYPNARAVGLTAMTPGVAWWTLTASVPYDQQGACGLRLREQAVAALNRHGALWAAPPGGDTHGS
jgi:small-conductance mechanosensitive channel